MLEKGVIEEIPPSEGYFSRLFLVPKPVGWRPIINLKKLNAEFLVTPHFRMNTTKDVADLLRPVDWAASIDLKDAYYVEANPRDLAKSNGSVQNSFSLHV